jgi:hypothetical protein
MPAQLEVHQTLSELPASVRVRGTQTIKAKLSALRAVFADARNDYISRFKSGSHYYADEIEDITSNKDELMGEIAALNKYIAVLSALPENAPQNLIELMEPYEISLRDANSDLGSWVSRCNQRIQGEAGRPPIIKRPRGSRSLARSLSWSQGRKLQRRFLG